MAVNNTLEAIAGPESSGKSQFYLMLAIALGLVFLASKLLASAPADSREPPLIKPKVPILGHALGMMMHQAEYFSILINKLQLPIFMIKIFGGPLYIINSPELTQSIFRHSKVFSFDPVSTSGSRRLFLMNDRQMELLAKPAPGHEDSNVEFNLASAITKAMHTVLNPGPNAPLLTMNARALNRFADFLNPIGKDGISIDMYSWFNEHFTVATSVGLYGVDSPFDHDWTLVKSLNDFEDGIGLLMMNVAPAIIASKAHRARSAMNTAFQKYYAEGGQEKTSGLITARYDILTAGGFTPDDIGSFDAGMMLAASMNSNPAVFWLLSYIYSDPELLSDIRKEASSAVSVSGSKAKLDLSQLLKRCPILTSCMQEMLRILDAFIGTRVVMEDTLLNDQYLLRKDGIIQLVCGPMHLSSSIWGSDSHAFDPRRFLKSNQDNLSKDSRKAQKSGYNPFGGGATLCPGRHFVTMEILGVLATIVVGYDITMQDGSPLKVLKPQKQAFAVQVKHVDGDLGVNIKRRDGWEGLEWIYDTGVGEVNSASDLAF